MNHRRRLDKLLLAGLLLAVLTPVVDGVRAEEPYDPEYLRLNNGVPPGCMVIEGDILVPIDFYIRRDDPLLPQGCFDDNLWPNAIVPFDFDANVDATNQQRAIDAMAEWEAVSRLDFVARTGQSDYIRFRDSSGDAEPSNSSYVGRQGGRQIINIVSWTSRFIIAHEVCHSLGCWHEQSRTDRDTFVTIETSRIESGKAHNFDKESGSFKFGPYDFDSVMHYGQCSFSNCPSCQDDPAHCCSADPGNCRTITVKAPYATTWQTAIGQRNHLSTFDELTVNYMYREWYWIFVDWRNSGSEDGSIYHPYNTFLEGYNPAPAGGVVHVMPGTYHGCDTIYTKAMTVLAPISGLGADLLQTQGSVLLTN